MRPAGFLALAAVLLVGCGTGDRQPATADAPPSTAAAVPGVASCAELPQQARSGSSTADHLPPLQLPCLTIGPSIDLSALGGGPVLINLWASWCGPCRAEMPLLQAAHERYGERVAFLGVDTRDSGEAAADFLGAVGVTYPQVVDSDGDLLAHLGPQGLPVTVVLDRDGRVAGMHVGQLDDEGIAELLAAAQL
ncbi:MAG: TlpA family protein disulfide reductase [Geodermatophilaceae bacterium]|nr:TlpA family protein disulfide reductase [Geodermatophilaceae bacterium]